MLSNKFLSVISVAKISQISILIFSLQLHISREIDHFSAVRAMQEFIVKKQLSHYFHPIDKTE